MSVKDRLRQVEALKAVPDLTKFGAGEPGFEKTKGVPLTEFDGDKWVAKLAEEWWIRGAEGGQSQSGAGHWFKLLLECYTPGSDALGQPTEVFYWFPYEAFDEEGWVGDRATEDLKMFYEFLERMGLTTIDDLNDEEFEGSLEKAEAPFKLLNGKVISGTVTIRMDRNKKDPTKVYGPKVSLGYSVPSDLDPPVVPY